MSRDRQTRSEVVDCSCHFELQHESCRCRLPVLSRSWFVSTEAVRNLLERYSVGEQWAGMLGIDTIDDMWENKIAIEVDTAVVSILWLTQYQWVNRFALTWLGSVKSSVANVLSSRAGSVTILVIRTQLGTWRCVILLCELRV
jgi:hypothetical protein